LEILVLLAVLIGVLFFALRGKNSHKAYPPPTQKYERERRTPTKPVPFDVKSAQPQQSNVTLNGSAYVVDGDTLVIQKTQVRLFGVDAPEMNHPYGKKAKWALVALCKGQTIKAEVTDKDDHGRTVAKCYLGDGRDLSAEMVKQGLAIDWPKFSGGQYRSLEVEGVRKKLWLADARQKGRMHVWEKYEAKQAARNQNKQS